MKAMSELFKMKRMLKFHAKTLGLSYDCEVKIHDYTAAFTQIENGKPFHYPETFTVKIESWSNHFYDLRVSDGRMIREGTNLNGPGVSVAYVYRKIRRELKEHAAKIQELKNSKPKLEVAQ